MGKKVEDMTSVEINKKIGSSEAGYTVGSILGGGGACLIGAEIGRNLADAKYNSPKGVVFGAIAIFLVGISFAIPSGRTNVILESERTRRLIKGTW